MNNCIFFDFVQQIMTLKLIWGDGLVGIFNTNTAQKAVCKSNGSIRRYEETWVKIIASTGYYLKCKHSLINFDDFERNHAISSY